jgi:hypothetical protein
MFPVGHPEILAARLASSSILLEDHRMHIACIGIDLGKTTFHLVAGPSGHDHDEEEVLPQATLACTANRPSSLVGIEACSGANVSPESRKFFDDLLQRGDSSAFLVPVIVATAY